MRALLKGIVAATGMGIAATTMAFPVEMADVHGEWFDVQGGSNVNTYTQSNGYEVLSWGYNSANYSSKYGFNGVDGPVSIGSSDPFTLGLFAHQNQPIPHGTAITGASLRITTEFSNSGGSSGTQTGVFEFQHEETPNIATVEYSACKLWMPFFGCLITKTGEKEINFPVDDIVSFNQTFTSSEFQLGTSIYSLELLGFKDFGGNYVNSLETAEENTTYAELYAKLNMRTVSVPEPGTLALLGLGLAGLGLSRRRKA